MASVNGAVKRAPLRTAGGAIASRINGESQLRRVTLANMLWENQFYVDGKSSAAVLAEAVANVRPSRALEIAVEARSEHNIRHAPLLIVREMARIDTHKPFVADALFQVIQRPDELAEFLAIYWKDNPNAPLAAQVKKGLARAFTKFSEFQLAKYDQEGAVRLRDVLFLTHAKPKDEQQADVWRRLVTGQLRTPDTWEVALSSGANKRTTFERLMAERKLGGMAFLMNLRNMREAGVSKDTVLAYMDVANFDRILPFRFISAAKEVPMWEDAIEVGMMRAIEDLPKFSGKTVFILDVSGSMSGGISAKSKLNRFEAGAAIVMIGREMSQNATVYATAGDDYRRIHATREIKPRHGFALRDELQSAMSTLGGGGIFLTQAMDYVFQHERTADRVIVVTDEQDTSGDKYAPAKANAFGTENYIVNIAAYKNGIGYEKFTKIDGFSTATLKYIQALENNGFGASASYQRY